MPSIDGLARRNIFRRAGKKAVVRPPWLVNPLTITDDCTRCGHCITACPEHILHPGDGGFPEVDFNAGECTLCAQCTRDCEAHLFTAAPHNPADAFTHRANISEGCLTLLGVMCRSCEDACEPGAIRFTPTLGAVARPRLDLDACTGCGACISPCPENAISMV
jgi:ferredoxin-type protein NapF